MWITYFLSGPPPPPPLQVPSYSRHFLSCLVVDFLLSMLTLMLLAYHQVKQNLKLSQELKSFIHCGYGCGAPLRVAHIMRIALLALTSLWNATHNAWHGTTHVSAIA
ncbi:hypothetical protein HaLaN_33094 [Haematococcus lacustris]|uniref:Uncharacterized protein n=1 Tax=Haematococcus lacustris TaxID=44745 RepID=A0A6A0APX4_HAELA|nr:hypothetical protein HaLaN_33094 [Haematococcus lacustris]